MPISERWRSMTVAALPTPIRSDGQLHDDAFGHLVHSIGGTAVGGIAVGTPLGRGTRLSADQWKLVLVTGRERLPLGKTYLASVGAPPSARHPREVFNAACLMAATAASSGVDLLIAEPPVAVRGRAERDRLILEYHAAIAETGLPLLISYQREVSGGIAYSPEVLAQLLARPEVLGVQIATIDGIAIFQQVEALAREFAPEKLVVSGEERFLGYSLLSGAQSVIVGIGCLEPELVARLMEAHVTGNAPEFLGLAKKLDNLARPIFRSPSEGSTIRVLRELSERGLIPTEATHDPWG